MTPFPCDKSTMSPERGSVKYNIAVKVKVIFLVTGSGGTGDALDRRAIDNFAGGTGQQA
jgi:hypothetical protein